MGASLFFLYGVEMNATRIKSTIVQNSQWNFDIISYCETENLAWVETRDSSTFLMRKKDAERIYNRTVKRAIKRRGARVVYSGTPLRG
jgi:hypothetical protein